MGYAIVVNENTHDAHAAVVPEGQVYPLSGWERVWSWHDSLPEAEAALPAAKHYADGRRLP